MSETTAPENVDILFAKDNARISEETRQIREFTEIQFVPGKDERVGYFPNLEDLTGNPVLARFSYGLNSPNMSTVFFDKTEGSQESELTGERNTREFLKEQGFGLNTIQALGKFEGNEAQIEEVDKDTLKDKTKAVGNVIFTRDPEITLIIKPADCPTGILYCKDKEGRDVVAIIHGGADAINAGLTRQGLMALQLELGVDLSQAKLAIFPGVSKDNYYISKQWKTPDGQIKKRESGIYPMNWGEHISSPKTDDPEEKRYVDILGAFEMQALQAGMKLENVEAYGVDTYADAARGRAYSRRYSNEHNGEHPGGNLVAVQLRKTGNDIPERTGRFDRSILPDSAELARILEKESKRTVPEENQDIHFPQFDTAVKIFEHYGVSPEVFTDLSLKIGEVLTEGKKLLDELVQKILANPIDKDEIALFDAAYSYLSEEDIPQTSDMIFVFGAKTPLRAEKALELYRSKLAGKVMVSGGSPFYQPDEEAGADRYKGILVSGGVPQEDIISENRSITMPDNVRSSLNLLDTLGTKPESMILVNSPYAQRRGWSLMRKYLPKSVVLQRVNAGVDLELSKDEWYKTENSLRVVLNEFIKMRSVVASNKA